VRPPRSLFPRRLDRAGQRTSNRRALVSAGLVLAVMLLAWYQSTGWYRSQLLSEYKAQAALRASLRGNALALALEQRFALLNGLQTYVQLEGDTPDFEQAFQQMAAALCRTSCAQGIRWFSAAPEGVVRYIHPTRGNEDEIGRAPLTDPRSQVREQIQRAIDSRKIVLISPGDALGNELELVAQQAVYLSMEDGQEDRYWGLVAIAIDLFSVLQEAELDIETDITLDYALRDGAGHVLYGSQDILDQDPVIHLIPLAGDAWELAGVPEGGWEAQVRRPLRISQIAWLIIAILVAGLAYLVIRHQGALEHAFARQRAITEQNIRLHEHAQQVAVLEERQRIARELHDSVSQALYGIGLGAETARELLQRDPRQAVEPLNYVLSLAEAGLSEMRALVFELRPDSLQREGLVAALNKQAAALKARHGLEVIASLGQEPDLPIEIKEALYRIAQEATNNVVKHAQARRVEIRLEQEGDTVSLTVQDDGAGFDPQADYPGHVGLLSMQERAQKLGGTLEVESAPNSGARLTVTLPLADPP